MIRTILYCLCSLAAGYSQGQTWRNVFGAYGQDEARAVRWVGEELIMVAGSTGSGGAGGSDIYLLALDGAGSRLWSVAIGTTAIEQASDLLVASDGTLVIAGSSNAGGDYDGLLVKTDPLGQVIWQYTYGGDDWDFFRELIELPNGDVMAVGQSFVEGVGSEVWLVRVDADGMVLSEHFYGGLGEQDGHSLCTTVDGFAVAGSSGTDDASDVLLIRLDPDMNVVWSHTYGGDSLQVAYDVLNTTDGGFSVVGLTHRYSVFEEGYHLKTDGDGVQQWERNWGQINDQGAYEHLQLPTGEFMTIGYTKTSGGGERDMFLLKSTEGGDFMFGRTFGGGEDDVAFGLDRTDTGFLCAGWTMSYGAGGRDVLVVRTDDSGATETQNIGTAFDPVDVEERAIHRHRIHPNPCRGEFTITGAAGGTVRIVDANGRAVLSPARYTPGALVQVDLVPGLYLVEVGTGAAVWRSQLVIVGE